MRNPRAIIFALTLSALLFGGVIAASAQTTAPTTGQPNLATRPGAPTDASTPSPLQTEVPLPISPLEQGVTNAGNGVVTDVSQYIGRLYNFLIGIIGLVAAVMMIAGGFQYITSAGDSAKIGAAKKRIGDAVIGVVLALGSYLILNTINPALLKFQPLSAVVSHVSTTAAFMPWCEDMKVPVTDISHVTDAHACGYVGTYRGTDGSAQYCVYHGANCNAAHDIQLLEKSGSSGSSDEPTNSVLPADGKSHTWTCLQRAGLTKDFLDQQLGKTVPDKTKPEENVTYAKPDSVFGACLRCHEITQKAAAQLNMSLDDACTVWQNLANAELGKVPVPGETTQRYWEYCGTDSDYNSCEGAGIDCHAVNNNSDAHDSYCEGGRSDGGGSCGCEGYDDSPSPIWSTKNLPLDANGKPASESALGVDFHHQLDSDLHALEQVCGWNPCEKYVDPAIKPGMEGQCPYGNSNPAFKNMPTFPGGYNICSSGGYTYRAKAFANGCLSPSILAHAPIIGSFSKDCRNRPPATTPAQAKPAK